MSAGNKKSLTKQTIPPCSLYIILRGIKTRKMI